VSFEQKGVDLAVATLEFDPPGALLRGNHPDLLLETNNPDHLPACLVSPGDGKL
jgi:hypothetical protein